jgi:adenylate cyclase
MRIRYRHRDHERIFDRLLDVVVLGRPRDGVHVDIDLTPDLRVSRPHARISFIDGAYWIEDLESANGTEIEGKSIKGMGKVRFDPGDRIQISETILEVDGSAPQLGSSWAYEDGTLIDTPSPEVDIVESISVTQALVDPGKAIDPSRIQDLISLYGLPLRFVDEENFDGLLQVMIDVIVNAVPSADRGALLLEDSAGGELLLKAHSPAGQPSIDMTLATHAMTLRQAFIWRARPVHDARQLANRINSAMYVPLTWKGRMLGVAYLDNSDRGSPFSMDDLRLMLVAGHYVAMAAEQSSLRNDLRVNTVLLNRLLTNFSPKLRESLLSQASQGRLRTGGQRSEVVLLEADIRGFTRLTAGMDADDVMDLLNDYFSALIEIIFQHNGTVDKINGDGIFAVFGSPEPDPLRYERAARAGLKMQATMSEVSQKRRSRGQVTCAIGIGIHCGEILHGFVGSHERMQLTLIGDAANFTARYCAGAGPGHILISPALHQRLWRHIDADLVEIDTKHEGKLPAYTLKGPKGTMR